MAIQIDNSIELADKIAAKASEALARLELEMALGKWPQDFRAIMWEAVAITATQRSEQAKSQS